MRLYRTRYSLSMADTKSDATPQDEGRFEHEATGILCASEQLLAVVEQWHCGEQVGSLLTGPLLAPFALTEVHCYCRGCDASLPHEDVRGQASSLIAGVVTLSVMGFCRPCRRMTPFIWRFRMLDDGQFCIDARREGGWGRHMPAPVGVVGRVRRWLRRFLQSRSR